MTADKTTEERFQEVIGQHKLKRKLNFLLDGHEKTERLPHLGFFAPKGCGKTFVAKLVKDYVVGDNGRGMLIDSSTLQRNPLDFIEGFYNTKVRGKNVYVVFDEAHNIPKTLASGIFLSMFQKQSMNDPHISINIPEYDGTIDLDLRKQKFAFATTDPDRIFAPLRDRMKILNFDPYNEAELSQIVKQNCESVIFLDDVLDHISEVLRGSPRKAIDVSQDIVTYCENKCNSEFGPDQWKELVDIMTINPVGLEDDEYMYLKEIKSRGGEITVSSMAAILNHPRTVVQEIEKFLIQRDLLKIGTNSIRHLTPKGYKIQV